MTKAAGTRPRKKTTPRTKVTAVNREAIRVLKEWAKTPPLHDEAFWDDFQKELRENRMTLRKRT